MTIMGTVLGFRRRGCIDSGSSTNIGDMSIVFIQRKHSSDSGA